MVGIDQARAEICPQGWEPATTNLNPFGGTKQLMTKPTYPGQSGNLNATPSEVSPTRSPLGGYPPNPADAANVNENIGRGQPATADYFSNALQLMIPCHLCGRAYSDTPGMGGPSIQEHIQQHDESPHMREGSDFGNDGYEA
jgi:hypothetical protein